MGQYSTVGKGTRHSSIPRADLRPRRVKLRRTGGNIDKDASFFLVCSTTLSTIGTTASNDQMVTE